MHLGACHRIPLIEIFNFSSSAMATFREKRTFLKRLRFLQTSLSVFGVFCVTAVLLSYFPLDVLRVTPATGGDTGSHYWTLKVLVEESLPNFRIRSWSPGNLAGEPQLVHYFPLPFLLMAALSLFMPLGLAFNLGTILPLVALPFSVMFCIRRLGFRFPAPLLGACATLCVILNESYNMWGGNGLSTLAGQFAHAYALNFFFLSAGLLVQDIQKNRLPVASSLGVSAVILSHGYVTLALPFLFLGLLWFPTQTLRIRCVRLAQAGVGAFLLSAWHILPMLQNRPWTTPQAMSWRDSLPWWEMFVPYAVYPLVVSTVVLGLAFVSTFRHPKSAYVLRVIFSFSFPVLGSVFLFYLLPRFGLVDARAVPLLLLCWCVLFGVVVGAFFGYLRRATSLLLSVVAAASVIYFSTLGVYHFPHWAKWNYSGWSTKLFYPELMELSKALSGDFSDPRVVYEHSARYEPAGTTRVFEMLPLFAGRSVLEGLYLDSTHLSASIYTLQALLSERPSCPVRMDYVSCLRGDFKRAIPKLKLFGIRDVILSSKKMLEQAEQTEAVQAEGVFGIWHVFRLKTSSPLVSVVSTLQQTSREDWKKEFYKWFLDYSGTQDYLVKVDSESGANDALMEFLNRPENKVKTDLIKCSPELKVQFNRIELVTDCPGAFHVIRFGYHPTFQASSGDELYLVSPGFIGIIPSEKRVVLEFGKSSLWFAANGITLTSLLFVAILLYSSRTHRPRH